MGASSLLRTARNGLRTAREVLALVDEARGVMEHAAGTLHKTPRRPRAVRGSHARVYEPDAIFSASGEPLYVRR